LLEENDIIGTVAARARVVKAVSVARMPMKLLKHSAVDV
jgi:hypothetical protein